MQVRESWIDGVRVLAFPGDDEVVSATLTFGVGDREESLPTQGVLHALEHLVMRSVRDTVLDINASVEPSITSFYVAGSPEEVTDWLARVCRALADPPVADLAAERAVIASELADYGRPWALLHMARYGCRDLGQAGAEGPGPEGITPEVLRAAAARWFVAGNALLSYDGPPLDRLRLELPRGASPLRDWPAPRRWSARTAFTIDDTACVVNLILPRSDVPWLRSVAVEVLEDRVTEAVRHDGGHSYVVDSAVEPTRDGQWDLVVWARPRPDSSVGAAGLLVSVITSLATGEVSEAEVARAIAKVNQRRRGRDAAIGLAYSDGVDELLAIPLVPRTRQADVTAEQVGRFLAEAVRDALFLLDARAKEVLAAAGLSEHLDVGYRTGSLPPGKLFSPPLWLRAINSDARQARAVLHADGIAQSFGDQLKVIDWSDVVGVVEDADEAEIVVYGADGAAIPVSPTLYRRGQDLIAAVKANVGPELIYPRSKLLAEPDDA